MSKYKDVNESTAGKGLKAGIERSDIVTSREVLREVVEAGDKAWSKMFLEDGVASSVELLADDGQFDRCHPPNKIYEYIAGGRKDTVEENTLIFFEKAANAREDLKAVLAWIEVAQSENKKLLDEVGRLTNALKDIESMGRARDNCWPLADVASKALKEFGEKVIYD